MDMRPDYLHFCPVPIPTPEALPITVEWGGSEYEAPRKEAFDTGWRTIPFVLIEVARGGEWLLELESETIRIPQDTVFWAPSGLRHRLHAKSGGRMRSSWIYLDWRWGAVPVPAGTRILQSQTSGFREAVRALARMGRPPGLLEQLTFQQLALRLLEPWLRESVDRPELPDARVTTALTYARNRLHEPLTRNDLARVAGLSPTRFHDVCVACTGIAPMRHLRKWRVQKATVLLMQTATPVGEIADQCGFGTLFYFSRVFKQATGASPMEFRHRYRNAR